MCVKLTQILHNIKFVSPLGREYYKRFIIITYNIFTRRYTFTQTNITLSAFTLNVPNILSFVFTFNVFSCIFFSLFGRQITLKDFEYWIYFASIV